MYASAKSSCVPSADVAARRRSLRTKAAAPRVAYLIVSHTLPDQVLRLASVLRRGSPDGLLVLHHDDRRSRVDRQELDAFGVHVIEPPSAADWGEISLLTTVLRGLQWCLTHTDFDWMVLLSGQDYPIRPVAEIERSLASADVDAFIETRQCDPPGLRRPLDEFSGRYYFRWHRARSERLASLARAAARKGAVVRTRALPSGTWIGVRGWRSPFGPHLICHQGADWFSLSRSAVQTVAEFVDRHPEILRYYSRTLHPTESFIQTVLANDADTLVSGDHRRYTVWDEPNQTGPRVLRLGDLDPMLGSGCDFARKFDQTVDGAVLDAIDRRVHSSPFPGQSPSQLHGGAS
jgi:Core-2/I-Branching enzyme